MKKKTILSTLFILTLIIAGCGYSIWNQNKENQKAIAWVEQQGGNIYENYPEWINKWPRFTKEFIYSLIEYGFIEKDLAVDIYNSSWLLGSDISGLKKLSNLTHLRIEHTQVSDISVLKNLSKLKHLYITNTPISNISALKNLSKLTILDLSNTQINDVNALKNLSNLEELALIYNKTIDISALKNLKKLTHLHLYGTMVNEEQFKELQLKNPKLKIFR